MCTAISYKNGAHYFGRTLDLEYSYNESVTITPRNYPFKFRKTGSIESHYAMIGMAYVQDNYPLYYEATNEAGLSMAGLNFPNNAFYGEEKENADNITPFEFIPWILSQCKDIAETKKLLSRINLVNINYSEQLPLSPLHWMISDKESSIVVESVKEGLKIYENPVGVMTNNPPFEYHLKNYKKYSKLTNKEPERGVMNEKALKAYGKGKGALGLPGDFSPLSRFVRAAFVKNASVCGMSEEENVTQYFHIMTTVSCPKGCIITEDNKCDITIYTSCCNTDDGIYYYTTYNNRQITAVDMKKENLDLEVLVSYPIVKGQQIYRQN